MARSRGGRLRIYLDGDSDSLERAAKTSQTAVSGFPSGRVQEHVRKESLEASEKFSGTQAGLSSSLGSAAKYAAGSAVAYLGFSQITDAISSTQGLAKATLSLNHNLGLSVEKASEWAAVAQTRGVDSTKLAQAFKTLATQITAARDGSTTAIAEFKRLGFTEREIDKGARNTSFLIGGVADGLNHLAAGSDKAAISGRLFGRGWQSVQPVLRDGSAELQKQLDLAKEYGATFGQKQIDSMADLLAAQRELKMAQLGLQVQFTEHLAPALIDVGLGLAHFANDARRGKGAAGDFTHVLVGVGQVLVAVTKSLLDQDRETKPIWDLLHGSLRLDLSPRMDGPLGKPLANAVFALGHGFSAIGHGIGQGVGAISNVVHDVASFLAQLFGGAVDAIGASESNLPTISVDLPKIPASFGAHHWAGKQRGGIVHMAQGGAVWRGVPPTGLQPGIKSATSALLAHFPGLTVTSTIGGSHASGSYHYKGEATDTSGSSSEMFKASEWIKSSGLFRSLVEGIHNPNLAVSGGQMVSPSFYASVWAEHANHIHMAVSGAVSGFGVASIPPIKVHGSGPVAGYTQVIADRLRDAGNEYLSQIAPPAMAATAAHGEGVLSETEFLRIANQAIQLTGHHDFTAEGLLILARQESSLRVNPPPPNDINTQRGDPSMGLMQITGSNFRKYHQPGTSTNIVDPLANIAASINYQAATYGGQVTHSPYQRGGVVGDDDPAPRLPESVEPVNEGPLDPIDLSELEDALRENIERRRALKANDTARALTGVTISG